MQRAKDNSEWLDRIATGLALTTAAVGVLRALSVRPLSDALNDDTLKFFAVAGALLLLRKVRSISFGDTKVELAGVEAKADEALEEARTASSMAQHLTSAPTAFRAGATGSAIAGTGVPAADSTARRAEDADPWSREPGTAENDPWKGVFGGKAERNHRRLRAQVKTTTGDPDWFRIRLWVESTDPENHPLTDRVRFFIHDSFSNHTPFVPVVNGRAELRLHAYGAFTVGALADDGETELEFDLADDRSFPKRFREN